MANVRSISSEKYNKLLAEALKNLPEFSKPEWVDFVKTSAHKERPTFDVDFWHKRAASVLRQIYIRGTVGVQRLRTRYGGRKNRGAKPAVFYKGAGKVIRTILQQADKAGFTEMVKGKHAGRKLTQKGKDFMEALAK